jgi:hypothetical protein
VTDPTLAAAVENIRFARAYTLRLLDSIPEADWFRSPGGVTHVAWQVGHLAMAEYRLCLERVRGVRPEDEAVMPAAFLARFLRESVPAADATDHPTPAELRATLDRVHRRVEAELPAFAGLDLSDPPLTEHRLAKTKMEILFWCGQHEMMHAGQIGLLRRLLGQEPQW